MEQLSVINSFTTNFNNWLQNELLSHLAEYLKTHKKVDVTLEELKSALQLPSNVPLSEAMGLPKNTMLIPSSQEPVKGRKGRKKIVNANAIPCGYVFTKGKPDKDGKTCGEDSIAYGYCIQCITKTNAIIDLEKRDVNKEFIQAIRSNSNNKAKLREILSNVGTVPKPTVSSNVLSGPNFTPVEDHKGFYIMEDNVPGALFVKINPTDPYVCHGKMDLKINQGPFPLTKEEADLIKSLGYAYSPPKDAQPEVKEESSPQVAIPQVVVPPNIPQVTIPVSMPSIVKDTLYPISNFKI